MKEHYLVICPAAHITNARRKLKRAGQGDDNFPTEFIRSNDPNETDATHYAAGINKVLLERWMKILEGLPVRFIKGDLKERRWWKRHTNKENIKKKRRDRNINEA